MPLFQIHHITKYTYDRPVRESTNQIKIYPYSRKGQLVDKHLVDITGTPSVNQFTDYWGNSVGWFTVVEPHVELVIDSQLRIHTHSLAQNPLIISKKSEWQDLATEVSRNFQLLDLAKKDSIEQVEAINAIITELRPDWDAPAMFIQRCSEYIFNHFNYKKGITNVETTIDEILAHRSGVCQDFAHILLQLLRSVNIPARYVSGYICPNRDGVRGAGATHAWVEAWLPLCGWVGIDPTNNTWVDDNHVVLAVGRHFSDCSPVKGTFKGPANQLLSVFVSVGYEDGSSFEDINAVNKTTEKSIAPVQNFDVMQQQQ